MDKNDTSKVTSIAYFKIEILLQCSSWWYKFYCRWLRIPAYHSIFCKNQKLSSLSQTNQMFQVSQLFRPISKILLGKWSLVFYQNLYGPSSMTIFKWTNRQRNSAKHLGATAVVSDLNVDACQSLSYSLVPSHNMFQLLACQRISL